MAVGVLAAVAVVLPAMAQAQVCGPLDNGHIADVSYEGTVAVWRPVIEYDRLVLTVTAPCEQVVKEFGPKDEVIFDLGEVSRTSDGQYTWELRAVPVIDPKAQEELEASRGTGKEDAVWWSLWQKGLIYGGPSVESGSFLVDRGSIVPPSSEEKSSRVATKDAGSTSAALAAAVATGTSSAGSGGNVLSTKDTVLTNADGVIRNSLCVGFDCANSNTYSDTTILLTENNTRIKFDDTSTISGYPNEDWELQANSSNSGGGNFFAINDCGNSSGGGCSDDPVFIVEGGAPANSIRVDNAGRVGFGTANPVVELHVVDGDTPTLRLDQDGSSGFAPQKWDVAGNETNFFVRDATNGSTLPFRIRPGAPSNAINIAASGDVGIGTGSPDAPLHVLRTGTIGSDGQVHIENTNSTAADRNMLRVENNGPPTIFFSNTNAGSNGSWTYTVTNGGIFQINASGSGSPIELQLSAGGDMTIGGMLTELSSREAKTNFQSLDSHEVLERLASLPVEVWSYKHDVDGTRHIGPMAEDFYSAFGVGVDPHHIAPSDKAGVALVAIQGLQKMVEQRDQELAELQRDRADLEKRVKALEELVARSTEK